MVSGGDIFISGLLSEERLELGVGLDTSRFVPGSVEFASDRFKFLFVSSLAARLESLLVRFASLLARVELVDSTIASVKLCLEFVSILWGQVCSAVAEARSDCLISQFRLVSVSPSVEFSLISVSP